MNKLKKQGGFTLVELIIVIAILAILTVAAIPIYNGVRDNADKTAAASDASVLANTLNNFNVLRKTGYEAINEVSDLNGKYASGQLTLQYGSETSEYLNVQIGSAEYERAIKNINCTSGYWQLNDDIE